MERRSRNEHSDGPRRECAGDEELFRRHHQQLIRLIQRRLRVSPDIAEDAVALAWLQLVRTQPHGDNIVGWLYTVAKHQAFALLRAASREQPVDEIWSRRGAPAPDELLETRTALLLIDRLKPQQRTVLHLQMAGLSYNEISQQTGHTYTWVNRHLTEGRQALRRLIDEQDP